jgi:plasmid maintenance system killer protein
LKKNPKLLFDVINAGEISKNLPTDIQDNRLESLKGRRRGQHSIRINDKWRICFVWEEGQANKVEIVDYH